MANARAAAVVMHRWVGLGIAGFLVIAGLTGSLLAWNDVLDAALYPALRVQTSTDLAPLDPLTIRDRLQARYPQVTFSSVDLYSEPGKAMLFNVQPLAQKNGSAASAEPGADAQAFEQAFDQLFVNPYTGQVQGARLWGDLSQGWKNFMPFVYRLHYSLALGTAGTSILGIVGLLWTLDCFIGMYLSFPARLRRNTSGHERADNKPWLIRWRSSWRVRWPGGNAGNGAIHKLNFDLHRAGGLWIWAMLFVIAWSSVSFNLPGIYNPTMAALFDQQTGDDAASETGVQQTGQLLSWQQARESGRFWMHRQSVLHHFHIEHEASLSYDASRMEFRYTVRSSRDIRDKGGATSIWLDAGSDAMKRFFAPTRQASGDTIRTWLTNLHKALLGGAWFKSLVTLTGMVVVLLCTTGSILWIRKRRAKRLAMTTRTSSKMSRR
ncbi:PepSY domain-containing protein [Undibacterium sp. CY18W]|uniref:PepSY domain-containing protein n=1 Tax=Undibacterium hunanense TaxID=2762292 RepID=A0ABR6ZRI0_9BURK|nr:PepSY-associated TM helix domain-containing protein [Undibacterium hunanense]MBC3918472.1 PepSY domain-containing protein [Undibacterium hunanense]